MLSNLTDLRKTLLAQQKDLQKLLQQTEADSAPVELDQTTQGRLSRMDAIQLQAMAQATRQRREIELKQIATALKRMQDGDYGYCYACDEPIAEKRLRHNPAVLYCIKCAP